MWYVGVLDDFCLVDVVDLKVVCFECVEWCVVFDDWNCVFIEVVCVVVVCICGGFVLLYVVECYIIGFG